MEKNDEGWKLRHILREPAAINAAQFLANLAAATAGLLAVVGGLPHLLTAQIGPVMAVGVGCILLVGGSLGAFAVITGTWWLERVSLLIVAVGWVSLLPAVLSRAVSNGPAGSAGGSHAIWLVVALLVVALSDVFKRYKRIDWAYLDPTR